LARYAVRIGLWVFALTGYLTVLSLPAFATVEAVAAPETQTVALNGAAAEFDGSEKVGDIIPFLVGRNRHSMTDYDGAVGKSGT
jgi:hypothetical protein